jgi:hypothetical protein
MCHGKVRIKDRELICGYCEKEPCSELHLFSECVISGWIKHCVSGLVNILDLWKKDWKETRKRDDEQANARMCVVVIGKWTLWRAYTSWMFGGELITKINLEWIFIGEMKRLLNSVSSKKYDKNWKEERVRLKEKLDDLERLVRNQAFLGGM